MVPLPDPSSPSSVTFTAVNALRSVKSSSVSVFITPVIDICAPGPGYAPDNPTTVKSVELDGILSAYPSPVIVTVVVLVL